MKEQNEYDKILCLIDKAAVSLVGILCKRIEVLEDVEKKENRKILIPSLYKALVKELVYENARHTKSLIKILKEGKIIFKTREK